ncbi:anti-sigma factor family protein [Indiicoccus explosivorum]|uniref:anti-sigma factor family protein n=1 Tax=Indiicoccus explosivorum TaxID=1917864 RepID=UPI000B43C10C|nr:zf-HC2 domain-containing protein [Indiicoccus explosivorum]
MTCLDIGTLQAYLDGEVSRDEKKRIMRHLEHCRTCRNEIAELQSLQAFFERTLAADEPAVDTEQAWTKFEKRLQGTGTGQPLVNKEQKARKGWSELQTKTKRLIASGVAAAAIVSSFAIPQVQVGASQFLSLFRVDQFEMVQLTQNDLEDIEQWVSENEAGELDLKGIGKLERTGASGEPQQFQTAEEAAAAGYSVPQLEGFETAGVHVLPAQTITFTLNIEKANQLLAQLGSDEQFNPLLDGKPFSVAVPDAVSVNYVTDGQPITYVKTESPEITVPEGVSVAELRDTLLSLPFIPENVKTQLAGITDFETTLPVPQVNSEEADVNEISVGGAEGFNVESDGESFVVWQADSNIHMVVSEDGMGLQDLIRVGEQINQ